MPSRLSRCGPRWGILCRDEPTPAHIVGHGGRLRTTHQALVVVVGWLGSVAGCRSDWSVPDVPQWDVSPGRAGEPHQTDRIVASTAPEADFLWVIDDSCSMADEQAALVDAFPVFAERIIDSGLDYHVGVVSTDIDRPWVDGHLQAGPTGLYIDRDTDDPIAEFAQMASLGTMGAPFECGIGAAYHALGANVALNGDFYRSGAALHTVVISDEDDETPDDEIDPVGFAAWYAGLKAPPTTHPAPVNPAEPPLVSFSSIVTLDRTTSQFGLRYLAVTALIGGTIADIGAQDRWDEVLGEIADQSADTSAEFFLSLRPDPPTIEVLEQRTDGVSLPHEPDVWAYDPVRNSVRFDGYAPQLGATLVFDYTPLAPGP